MVVQPLQEYKRAQRQLRNALRAYVDEWLDSGLHSDGREEPLHRSLTAPRKGWRDSAFYLELCPPAAQLDESGNIDFYFQFHDYNRVSDRGPKRFGDREPKIQAEHDAVQRFLQFLQSEWKYKLAKCRRCGKYFAGTRTLHKMYKRGIHCRACASKVTAIESKKASNERWRVRWMQVAATIWPHWKAKDGDRAAFVAKKVNKALGPSERHITRWSITHYRSRIEQMSKSLSEKKGSESSDPQGSSGRASAENISIGPPNTSTNLLQEAEAGRKGPKQKRAVSVRSTPTRR